jgi:tRNA threonylcarbamoyladenosine biosynthesis protein TsaB
VAVVDGARVLASASEPMARGHQERLAPMAREVMARAGLPFDRLDRVGVTLGPGSFTGLRVGLAFAKGLGLALDVPCVGVGTLAALAASVETVGRKVAVIDAGRGRVYLQAFEADRPLGEPESLALAEAAQHLAASPDALVVGPGARLLHPRRVDPLAAPRPEVVARLAAAAPIAPPKPLYLRAPDARLPGGVLP